MVYCFIIQKDIPQGIVIIMYVKIYMNLINSAIYRTVKIYSHAILP